MRTRAVASTVAVVLAAACGGATPSPPSSSAGPIAVVTLPVGAGGAGSAVAPVTVSIARDAAQVQIRLPAVDRPADELTAELESTTSGEVRRWPVDGAPPGADPATRAVTVPAYAVAAGGHVLTLWAGDADQLRRVAFTVVAP